MCSVSVFGIAQNHKFGHILTFGGFYTDPLLPMRAKFSALEQTHGIRLLTKFRIDRFILSLTAKNPIFVPFSGLRHLVVSPVGSSLRKLNTGAQLQTFPYPTALKSFLYSNAFMAKSGAQSLTFKSVTDKHTTDRKTDKKLNVFAVLAAGEI